jgi:hypothetical protein
MYYCVCKLQVFLPSGDVVYAQVEVRKRKSSFINVWIVAAGNAFNQTEGRLFCFYFPPLL